LMKVIKQTFHVEADNQNLWISHPQ